MATQRAPRPTVNKKAQWIDMVCICMHDAIGLAGHSSSQGWPHAHCAKNVRMWCASCCFQVALQFKPYQHCPHHLAHGWARPHRPTLVSCCWYTPFHPLTPDDTGFSTLSPLVQQHNHIAHRKLWKKVTLFDGFDVNSTAPISKTDFETV
jgi:hypothetical protein